MRGNAIELRTRLFAAVGALALLAWGATLFGLGSWIGAPASVVEVPALPALPAAGTLVAPVPNNAEALARPLFANDRRPHPFMIGGNGQASPTTLRLTGVLLTPTLEMATLTTEQGHSLRLRVGGQPQEGWQLLSLRSRSAEVSGPAGVLQLELQTSSEGMAGSESGMSPANGSYPVPPPPPPLIDSPTPMAQPKPEPPSRPELAAPAPADEQIQAIRERIQARRRQMQQTQNGRPGGQNPQE